MKAANLAWTLVVATTVANAASPSQVPIYGYDVIRTFVHQADAFTQGLAFENEIFYEGTGLYGQSSLRKLDLHARSITINPISAEHFGEGITLYQNQIIQLTWRSHIGFVYDKRDFRLLNSFRYPTEGWGITYDGINLIMSDGTATLYRLDPVSFLPVDTIQVHDGAQPVDFLNELEYVKGEIYANVWETTRIARISPKTGAVIGWIELAGLAGPEMRDKPAAILNGIAYDAKNDRLFVTGKLWSKIYEIRLVPQVTRKNPR